MPIEIPDGEFDACLKYIEIVMFLDTWFPTQGDLEPHPPTELTPCQHWNPQKMEFPQAKYYEQEKVEGRSLLKATICFSRETPGDTNSSLDGETRGDFRSYGKELVVHAGM